MQVDKATKNENLEQHWREVIARADQDVLGYGKFCEREGISKSNFYRWRGKLSISPGINPQVRKRLESQSSNPQKSGFPFSEIKVIESKQGDVVKSGVKIEARWVAEFILHLHGGLR